MNRLLIAFLLMCLAGCPRQKAPDSAQPAPDSVQVTEPTSRRPASQRSDQPLHQGKALADWIEGLSADDWAAREEAAKALGEIGDKQAAPAIVTALEEISSASPPGNTLEDAIQVERFRMASVEALIKIGPDAVPVLVEGLTKEDGHARAEAAYVLGEIGPAAQAAVPALVEALEGDPFLRLQAALALGKLGPTAKEAVPALSQAVKDEQIGAVAAEALARIDPQAASAAGVDPQVLAAAARQQKDTAPLGLAGVVPGITTEQELLDNPEWGKPINREERADGLSLLEFQIDEYPKVVVVVHSGVVRTIDASLTEFSLAEQWSEVAPLDELIPPSLLPPAAQVGPTVPETWRAARCTAGEGVLFVEKSGGQFYARWLRLYAPEAFSPASGSAGAVTPSQARPEQAPQSKPQLAGPLPKPEHRLPGAVMKPTPAPEQTAKLSRILDYRGAVPGQTTEAELRQSVAWGKPDREMREPTGIRYLEYRFQPWEKVVAVVQDGVVRTLDFTPPAGRLSAAQLAEVLGLGDLVAVDSRDALPPGALMGTSLQEVWRVLRCRGAERVLLFVEEASGKSYVKLMRLYSLHP